MKKYFLVLAALLFFQFALFAQEETPEKPVTPSPSASDDAKLREEVDSLITQLGSDDWQTREKATKRLIEIGAPAASAVAALRTCEDIEVRVRATRILNAIHWVSPEDVTKIEKLISEYAGEPSAELAPKIDQLCEKLSNKDYKIREEATKELIEIGRPALSKVEKLKDSDDAEVKTRAERIASEIIKKSQDLETELINQMKEIKHTEFYLIDRLCTLTTDPQRQVRIADILSGLLNLSGAVEEDGEGVIVRRQGQGRVVIIQRLKVLGQKGQGRIIINGKDISETGGLKKGSPPAEVLVAIVKDNEQNPELRARAARALAARNDKCAVMSLVNILSDLKEKLQLATAEALRELTGENFGPFQDSTPEEAAKAVEEWKGWLEKNKENETYRFKNQQSTAPEETDELGAIFKRLRRQDAPPKEAQEHLKKPQGEKEQEKQQEKEKENPPQEPEKERDF